MTKKENKGQFRKGYIPWNKGKKNHYLPWNKNKTGIFSIETLEKLSERMKGNKYNLGKKHSEETKEKMSIAQKGKKRLPFSQEWRDNISKSHKGKKLSEEHKKKIGEANKGHLGYLLRHTKETKRKIGQKLKGREFSDEHKINLSKSKIGEKNHNWQGGISFEPYTLDWTETLRRSIRERDKYNCKLCSKNEDLVVHHIDYNKLNCNPNNLITLCRSCNSKVNKNRDHWGNYFRNLLNNKP